MRRAIKVLFGLAVVVGLLACIPAFFPGWIWSAPVTPGSYPAPDAKKGAYIFAVAGCKSCHTKKGGKPLSGGHELKTPFGTFNVPNITQDKKTGIGNWNQRDFIRAMTVGLSPSGKHYYPAFPYASYTHMSLNDIRDMWAYLKSIPAVENKTADHELDFPYSVRPGLGFWKLIFLDNSRFRPVSGKSMSWNRGAYLVTGPAHCGECHTPRNFMGAMKTSEWLAGNAGWAAEGKKKQRLGAAPNITPHKEKGIGKWSKEEIAFALQTGVTPSGDTFGGEMTDVVENGTGKMTDADREAIADYLASLPPKP